MHLMPCTHTSASGLPENNPGTWWPQVLRAALDGGLLAQLKRFLTPKAAAASADAAVPGGFDAAEAARVAAVLRLLRGLPVTGDDLRARAPLAAALRSCGLHMRTCLPCV